MQVADTEPGFMVAENQGVKTVTLGSDRLVLRWNWSGHRLLLCPGDVEL